MEALFVRLLLTDLVILLFIAIVFCNTKDSSTTETILGVVVFVLIFLALVFAIGVIWAEPLFLEGG